MAAAPSPDVVPLGSRFENPCPFRFTREQYYRLGELGIFDGRHVELIRGEVIEKYPDDPADPSPRPFRFTREQYYRLGELGVFDGRHVELIRGGIVLMSPIKEPHVTCVSLATDLLKAAFGLGHYVRVQAPLNLGTTDPEPDVAVVMGSPRDYAAPPTTALLIVEVADTSLRYDTTTKAEEYATAGVIDYWVVDLVGRQLLVFRDPVALPAGLGVVAYRTRHTFGPGDSVSPLAAPGATIRVADLLP
jgi:Uma2 family endonuclease